MTTDATEPRNRDARDPSCVERWPEAVDGDYDPRCCRFPKSCSAGGWEPVRTEPATDATEPTPPPADPKASWLRRIEHLADENARLRRKIDEVSEGARLWGADVAVKIAERDAAEERYRQLAGEVGRVAYCVSSYSLRTQLLAALAATAPTDTPTTPLPDWERELLERQAADEAKAAQGESGLPTGKVGNSRDVRCPTCDSYVARPAALPVLSVDTVVMLADSTRPWRVAGWDTRLDEDGKSETVMRLRYRDLDLGEPLREQVGSEAQEGAEGAALIAATEEKVEAIWRDGAGTHAFTLGKRATDVWVETARRLAEALDGRPTAQIDRLTADLVRVTQERDEARAALAGEQLTVTEVLSICRNAEAERDALHTTLDATRPELDVTRRHAAKWRDIARRDGAALEDLRAKVREIAEDMEDVGVALDDMTIWAERLRAFDSVPTQTDRSVP